MGRQQRMRIAALPLFVAMALIVGCSNSPLAPEHAAGPNAGASIGSTGSNAGLLTSTTKVVSASINGLLGGTIKNGDWTVKIPAGAFPGTGVITVTVPDASVRSCDLNIFPSLLNSFRVPVTLSCRSATIADAQTDVMMWWDPSVKKWTVIPSTANLTTLTRDAPLSHFSTYQCGKAGW